MSRRRLSEEERRERKRESSRAYKAAHIEEVRAYQREYRKAHPEKTRAYMRKYYATHPEAAARAAAFCAERRQLREFWRARREEKILHDMEKRGYFV